MTRYPRAFRVLATLFLLLAGVPGAVARDASPVASPVQPSTGSRLDLAAMMLDQSDLPEGYSQPIFDNEGYTPANRMATIQFGGFLTAEEIDATGVRWFYSATFVASDGRGIIYVYLFEFPDRDAVQRGFNLFEDEQRMPSVGGDTMDISGPRAGQDPKEITVITEGDRFEPFVDATFRVDRVLAGVAVIRYGGDRPEQEVAEELSDKLAQRIDMVLSGESPPGIEPALATSILPLFATWSWPGNSLEGHKNAQEFLGTDGAPAELADDFEAGYGVFASSGSRPRGVVHDPPYIDIEIARLSSPKAALELLDTVEDLPTRHGGQPVSREEIETSSIPGVDDARMFWIERLPVDEPGSLDLTGVEVAFVQEDHLVVVSVWTERSDQDLTIGQVQAIAVDLAAQQAGCLLTDAPCGPVDVPDGLSVVTEGLAPRPPA